VFVILRERSDRRISCCRVAERKCSDVSVQSSGKRDSSSAGNLVPTCKLSCWPPQNDNYTGIDILSNKVVILRERRGVCHSEGAKRPKNLRLQGGRKENVSVFRFQEGKILRRPMTVCQITDFGVGLLRMTAAGELNT
jgi:hypothetical protein